MSELIQPQAADFRRQLLVTVSALALFGATPSAYAVDPDNDRPALWIELGGQLEQMSGQDKGFTAPFMSEFSPTIFTSPLKLEAPPRFSFGGEGTVSFQPEDSNWIFSASARYGRSSNRKNSHQKTPGLRLPYVLPSFQSSVIHYRSGTQLVGITKNANTLAGQNETHVVMDFQAGKDVGIGMFGGGMSVLSAGVRFAQFSSKRQVSISGHPKIEVYNAFSTYVVHRYPRLYFPEATAPLYHLSGSTTRNFHGIGPSLSWNASVPLLGNGDGAEFTLDWGANAAVLFGKQKATIHHKTSGYSGSHASQQLYHRTNEPPNRSRSVLVPNVGGMAGISLRFPNAKVSLGYRGDFFFGAMDSGIDTAKRTSPGFYGPYATISVGIGG